MQRPYANSEQLRGQRIPAVRGAASNSRAPEPASPDDGAGTSTGQLGALPLLTLVAACGLVVVATADNAARTGERWAQAMFWSGLLLILVPIAIRLFSSKPDRAERVGLLVVLGVALYLAKVLEYPIAPRFSDELAYLRTTSDLLSTNQLFTKNPIVQAFPYYPGLAICTAGVVRFTGLPLEAAGILVLGVARVVFMLALFHFFGVVSRSARIAGIASLVYLCNPNALFFGAEFSYESLALPFALLALYTLARRASLARGSRAELAMLALPVLAALIVTHHVTSFFVLGFLVVWSFLDFLLLLSGRPRVRPQLGPMIAFTLAGIVAWTAVTGGVIVGYLVPVLQPAISQFSQLLSGQSGSGPKAPFSAAPGVTTSPFERLVSYASIGIMLAGLPLGLWRLRAQRGGALTLTLAALALAYPASLALRLTPGGTETSNRASEFVFVGAGLTLAYTLNEIRRSEPLRRLAVTRLFTTRPGFAALAVSCITLAFCGGVIIGWAPYSRLPGSYLVEADPRSIDDVRNVAVAQWMSDYLGPGNRILTDRANSRTTAYYGRQEPVVGQVVGLAVPQVFFSTAFDDQDYKIMRDDRIRYLVVDLRLSTGPPLVGYYIERDEPEAFQHAKPIDPQALSKFGSVVDLSRVYDGGTLVIYDGITIINPHAAQ